LTPLSEIKLKIVLKKTKTDSLYSRVNILAKITYLMHVFINTHCTGFGSGLLQTCRERTSFRLWRLCERTQWSGPRCQLRTTSSHSSHCKHAMFI